MEEIKKVPEIRFGGFSEDWVSRKVKDIAPLQRGYDLPRNEMTSGKYPVVMSNGISYYHNKFIAKGPGVVTGRSGTIGNVHYVESDYWPHNTSLWVTEFNGNHPYYIFKMFQKLDLNRFGTGSGVPTLNRNDVHDQVVFLPKIAEQKQISCFLEYLDSSIKKHNTQLKKLANLKKAMLIKMFPQDGASVPEIRFKGYDGEWNIKTFEDIFNYHRPDPYIVSSTEYSNEYKTAVLTANKAFVLGYTNEKSTFNQLSIIFDDFTLDCKYVDFPFMVKSSALKILTIKNSGEFDLYFSYQLLKYANIEMLGHARHYIGIVQPTEVLVPEIDEQKKISEYFKNIDDLISNHKEQLKKLNQIKKACLSKLFVSQD